MEIAQLDTQNKNYLWGAPFCSQELEVCNKMLLVNDPDPTFKFYDGPSLRDSLCELRSSGCLNPLDRDYWNGRLDQRTFLIERPAVQHINRPQNTNFCNYRGSQPPILTDPKLNQESETYYQEFLTPRPKNLGLPTTDNQFCPASQMCEAPPVSQGAQATRGLTNVQGIQSVQGQLGRSPGGGIAGRKFMKTMYDQSETNTQNCTNSVCGVKYNVETESALRRLDHYCPTDVYDSRIDVRKISQNTLDQAQVYYPECTNFSQNPNFVPATLPRDQNCTPLQGLETPMVWRNLTKMRNRYLVEDISDSANLSECLK